MSLSEISHIPEQCGALQFPLQNPENQLTKDTDIDKQILTKILSF